MLTNTVPVRVMFLEPSALVTGGAIALLRLVSALDRRHFRPLVVLGSDGPLVAEFRRVPGCRVLCRPMPASLARVTRFSVFAGAIGNAAAVAAYAAMLRRIRDRWRPDVIHSNGLKTHLLSTVLRGANTTLVWHMRDHVAPPYLPARTAALVRVLARHVPQVVICTSEATRAALFPLDPAGAPPNVHTIPDGIECRRRPSRPRSPAHEQRIVLLGRIAEWKGQGVFVAAARNLCRTYPNARFIIAGGATTEADAAYERSLRHTVAAAGLSERIQFAGIVRDVPALLSKTDLIVHCSTSPEPFGQVIIEAMAAGVPVVASRLGAPATIIDDGVDGRLVTPGDSTALAGVIGELLDDEVLRARLGRAALSTVRRRFAIDRTVRSVSALYRLPHGRPALAAALPS